MTATGYFHCFTCDEDYPDSIQDKHLASHMETLPAETEATIQLGDIIFWGLCLAIGAILALLVASML